ncbi:DUF1801 domain-containing protein [Fodinibius salsisoli]|uniref:DUF1801 domain-containing protein n=1 Tax=Fodinibius salsisoli TaxID=2820877 RepID=A0ABT3PS80_9BACT|nr:DUF1801 domain-containing protein [Fodinibius salsisoli]MCW9708690.1 DUF1801 domain-containing protein [Fodinibius salsisoli]
MAALKTQPNDESVKQFLDAVENKQKREDSFQILEWMRHITGEEPQMWGDSIVGFGSYHYQYESGREGDWFLTGFSPRKQKFSLYIMSGFSRYEKLLDQLGKHKTGKSCLYIKRLSDIDSSVLQALIQESVDYMRSKYPAS